jgi:hypothetical protein
MSNRSVVASAWTHAMRSDAIWTCLKQTGRARVPVKLGLRPPSYEQGVNPFVNNPAFRVVEFTREGDRVVGEYGGEKFEVSNRV